MAEGEMGSGQVLPISISYIWEALGQVLKAGWRDVAHFILQAGTVEINFIAALASGSAELREKEGAPQG